MMGFQSDSQERLTVQMLDAYNLPAADLEERPIAMGRSAALI